MSDLRSVIERLEGRGEIVVPLLPQDGDCIAVSQQVTDALVRQGLDAKTVTVWGWVDRAAKVLGFVHQATLVGDTIVDLTATQFDRSLPAVWVAEGSEYLRAMAEATGVQEVTLGSSRTASVPSVLYHLTDKVDFKLDPKKKPDNNTTLGGSMAPGVFLCRSVEAWVNGYGYWRPWVVEFEVPTDLDTREGVIANGYGGEIYVPAALYPQLRIARVVPLDAHCREVFGAWGWTEEDLGTTFDTFEPIKLVEAFDAKSWSDIYPWRGYRYPGDARHTDPAWQDAYKKRVKGYARRHRGAYARKLSEREVAYRGVPLALSERQGVPILEALVEGQANVAARLIIDAMAAATKNHWWSAGQQAADEAGRWWTTSRGDAAEYSFSAEDAWMTLPVLMTAEFSDAEPEIDGQGVGWWHLPPGHPLTITAFEAIFPADPQGLLDDWLGVTSPGNFDAPRHHWRGDDWVPLNVPPMRTTAAELVEPWPDSPLFHEVVDRWRELEPGCWLFQPSSGDGWRAVYDREAMTPEGQERFGQRYGDAKFGWQRYVNHHLPGLRDGGKILEGKATSLDAAKEKALKAGQAEIDEALREADERDRLIPGWGGKTAAQRVIYRGLRFDLPPDLDRKLKGYLDPPMEPEDIDQHLKVGPELIKWLSSNHWQGDVGLGRFWSRRKEMAETAAEQGARSGWWSVVLTATYDESAIDTSGRWSHPSFGADNSEAEVVIKAGADLTITDAQLVRGGFERNLSVLPRSIRATAASLSVEASGGDWWHWSSTGKLEGDWIHAGTRRAAQDRQQDSYWKAKGEECYFRLRLRGPNLNAPAKPVSDGMAAVIVGASRLAPQVDYWYQDLERGYLLPGSTRAEREALGVIFTEIAEKFDAGRRGAVYYTNRFEDKGSVSVVAPRDQWEVIEVIPSLPGDHPPLFPREGHSGFPGIMAGLQVEARQRLYWHVAQSDLPVGTELVPGGPGGRYRFSPGGGEEIGLFVREDGSAWRPGEGEVEPQDTKGQKWRNTWVWLAPTEGMAYEMALKRSIAGRSPRFYLVRPTGRMEKSHTDWQDAWITDRAEVVAAYPGSFDERRTLAYTWARIGGKWVEWGIKERMAWWRDSVERGVEFIEPEIQGSKLAAVAATATAAGKMVLYHAAPKEAREDILANGLDWRRSPRASEPPDPRNLAPVAVYFSLTKDDALDMMSDGLSETHDLYEVDVKGLSLAPDPYQPDAAVYTRDRVPADRLRIVASWAPKEIDEGTPSRFEYDTPTRKGDHWFYAREQDLYDAGMPKGQIFDDVGQAQRYVNDVLRSEGITEPCQVIFSKERRGESGAQWSRDMSRSRIILDLGHQVESFLLHELSHIVYRKKVRKGPSHASGFSAVFARLLWERMGVSLTLPALSGRMMDRNLASVG